MIEATMVVLFLAMTFVLLVGIAGLYQAKLLAAHEARFRNTYNATNNCDVEGSSLSNPIVLPGEQNTSKLDGAIRRVLDVPRMVVFGGGLSRVAAQRDFAFGNADATGKQPFAHSVSWLSTTACNEPPASLAPMSVIEAIGLKGLVTEIASSMTSVF